MSKTMIEATTEIDALVAKKNEINSKIARLIAETIITKAKKGMNDNIQKDIGTFMNSLHGFSDTDKIAILAEAITVIIKNTAGTSYHSSNKSNSRNDDEENTIASFLGRRRY